MNLNFENVIIRNKKKSDRFLEPIKKYKDFIVVESPNLNARDTRSIRVDMKASNFIMRMMLKRLFHKLFIGKREKNEKTQFKNNLYILMAKEEAKFDLLFKLVRKYNSKIIAVVNDHQLVENFDTYILCQFNREKALCIFVKLITLPPLVILSYLQSIKQK